MTSPPTFIHEHQHSYTKYRIYPKYFDRQASEKSVDSKKDVSTLFNTSWCKMKKKISTVTFGNREYTNRFYYQLMCLLDTPVGSKIDLGVKHVSR